MNRLKVKFEKEIMPAIVSEFGIESVMAAPRPMKVVVNMGIGEAHKNKELLELSKKDTSAITGQMPQVRAAKKSVASFGIRRGMPVGLRVTLRGERMYSFLDKLFSIVMPRLRDFRGVSGNSFDKQGNYSIGITEHTVFPEIDIAKTQPKGMEVTIVTSTNEVKKARRLLELLGMPFEKK